MNGKGSNSFDPNNRITAMVRLANMDARNSRLTLRLRRWVLSASAAAVVVMHIAACPYVIAAEKVAGGVARYSETANELVIVRKGESVTRRIRCMNLDPRRDRVWGVEIHGDEIFVLVSPKSNSGPNKALVYSFKKLSGGGGRTYPLPATPHRQ